MASRSMSFSLKCPPPDAEPDVRARYVKMFKAAPVAASLYEGDFTLKITRRASAYAARKRATSRKRR